MNGIGVFCGLVLLFLYSLCISIPVPGMDAEVNGEVLQSSVAPQILDGTTMIPLRVISEALECNVSWDDASRTISITSKEPITPRESVTAPTTSQSKEPLDQEPIVGPSTTVTVPEETVKPTTQSESITKQLTYTNDGKHWVINDENDIVYVTDTGSKYHVAGCSSLRKSKHAITLGEATDQYYDACDKCEAPILDI